VRKQPTELVLRICPNCHKGELVRVIKHADKQPIKKCTVPTASTNGGSLMRSLAPPGSNRLRFVMHPEVRVVSVFWEQNQPK
jgi:hypothetical protein